MPKLPSLTSKKLLKILGAHGFEIDHITGSHYILRHPETKRRVTVPFHAGSLPKGTVASILRQAELSRKNVAK